MFVSEQTKGRLWTEETKMQIFVHIAKLHIPTV